METGSDCRPRVPNPNPAPKPRYAVSEILSIMKQQQNMANLWPESISLWTSQYDDIVAMTWHNDIVVLQYCDSESDQLLHKCTKCWAV